MKQLTPEQRVIEVLEIVQEEQELVDLNKCVEEIKQILNSFTVKDEPKMFTSKMGRVATAKLPAPPQEE